ncbi:unnamed protein product [Strongylus vulgaris]|uniref:Kinesin-like KIF1-type domain-containing protein n=1 Tax=Strongylus vulgaris TaxID=40348 RepID=A0A3P7LYH3_STRVU|nr:unnamed protein product [Strongylus vulgaris]
MRDMYGADQLSPCDDPMMEAQRLESMRDMYGADQLSPCDDPMMEALMGTDPFYDRFPWFRMIGR